MKKVNLLKGNLPVVIGIIILALLSLVALLAPLIAPYDPWVYHQAFLSPSWQHLLGTNDVGQDIFSELVFGGRISLGVGFLASITAVILGITTGMLAGFRRGVLDELLMGLTDVFLIVPTLPLVILVSVYMKPGLINIAIILGLTLWPPVARVIRSNVLSLRETGFVESIKALGAGDWWIIWKHLFPNIFPLVMAKFALTLAAAMLIEASISFLGLGDVTAKSWGMMLHYAFSRGGFIREMWWWYLPPGLLIGLSVFALNLINLGVEERGDPRLKRVLD